MEFVRERQTLLTNYPQVIRTLEVVPGQRRDSFGVAAVQGIKHAPYDLHVLLRHGPRSIPQGQESA